MAKYTDCSEFHVSEKKIVALDHVERNCTFKLGFNKRLTTKENYAPRYQNGPPLNHYMVARQSGSKFFLTLKCFCDIGLKV